MTPFHHHHQDELARLSLISSFHLSLSSPFNGTVIDYVRFENQFIAMVDSQNVSPVTKLSHLKELLYLTSNHQLLVIKNIPVNAYSENATTMKTEMKPSSTETTEKRMSSYTVATKIKTDQKLFPSSNRSNANAWNVIHN